VVFAHDTTVALQAAGSLANSGVPPDRLTTVEQLDTWYDTYSYTGRRDGTRADLETVRELRPLLLKVLTSDLEQTMELINRMLGEAQAPPQLVRHDPFDWHLHAVPRRRLGARIEVETATAMFETGSRTTRADQRHPRRRAVPPQRVRGRRVRWRPSWTFPQPVAPFL
jgi:hypothetical protein